MMRQNNNLLPATWEDRITENREKTLEQQELLVICAFCGEEYSSKAPKAIKWFKTHKNKCIGQI
jgi:hypothetical protein